MTSAAHVVLCVRKPRFGVGDRVLCLFFESGMHATGDELFGQDGHARCSRRLFMYLPAPPLFWRNSDVSVSFRVPPSNLAVACEKEIRINACYKYPHGSIVEFHMSNGANKTIYFQ